jgi:hypothetical protein
MNNKRSGGTKENIMGSNMLHSIETYFIKIGDSKQNILVPEILY